MRRLFVAMLCAGLVLASFGEARAGPFCGRGLGLRRLLPRNWGQRCSAGQAGSCAGNACAMPATFAATPKAPSGWPAAPTPPP
jgi:hypothetical protein